ncbi:hypothetical protein GWO43_21250, partial [candidate division KSB1 bacterium]|nr:hypothetical protein [candidate division KSB1 bacterium]NIS23136.1 hypothetical protein [candidate division KSB1 bacterium]NIT73353.1 hypothetical protein [candidate division KSB1 bacterium]NIU23630.1 hypothetical protein [candidate division KSB1 bacterium]NIU91576.1 hypothetical protein [candidate division KSB1 bacterium]
GVIRDRWNYNGVVFTDALNMGAIQTQFTPWQQAWLPLEAGADVLLMPEQIPLLHRFLVNRLQQDRQFRQQVEQAVDRIIALKRWIFKHQPAQPHPMRIYKIVEHPNHAGIAARVAERSITLLHNSKRFPLDLPDISKITNLIFTDSEFIDQPLRHFCKELQDFFEEAAILNNPLLKDIESLSLAEESVVVISLYFRTFAGHPQKLDWQRVHRVMKSLNQKNARLIMFVFGNPFRLNDLPRTISFDAIFLTYSYVKATQIAAFKALCSFIDINAKLPIQLKSRYDRAIKLEARTYRLEFPSGSEW